MEHKDHLLYAASNHLISEVPWRIQWGAWKNKQKAIKRTASQGTRKWEVNLVASLPLCSQKWSCLINKFPAGFRKTSKSRTVEYPNDSLKEMFGFFNELWWFWWNFHLQIWVVLDRSKFVSLKPVKKYLSAFCLSVSPSTEQNSFQTASAESET